MNVNHEPPLPGDDITEKEINAAVDVIDGGTTSRYCLTTVDRERLICAAGGRPSKPRRVLRHPSWSEP